MKFSWHGDEKAYGYIPDEIMAILVSFENFEKEMRQKIGHLDMFPRRK